jgi:hypothetical protein
MKKMTPPTEEMTAMKTWLDKEPPPVPGLVTVVGSACKRSRNYNSIPK